MSGLSKVSPTNSLASLLTRAVESLQRGDVANAATASRKALRLAPSNPDCHLVLATALHNMGKLSDAKHHYSESLRLKPDNPRVLTNLGMLQLNSGEGEQAVANLEKAVHLAPDAIDARHYLARALALVGQFHDALQHFSVVLERAPDDVDVLIGYARVLRSVERVEEALEVQKNAVRLRPDDDSIHRDLASNYAAKGQFDEAEAAARESIRLKPTKMQAYKQLSNYRRLSDADVTILEEHLSRSADLPATDRAALLFTMGTVFERRDDFAKAFEVISAANAIEDINSDYDGERAEEYYELLTSAVGGEGESAAATGHPSEKPIFIVGMPRSGTTLVEQILAGHPSVVAGGEQRTMPDGVVRLMNDDTRYTPVLDALDADQLQSLAEYYLDHLPSGSDTALRVTDKLPGNIRNLVLISRMFPNARFILCRRHPMDVAWSIFKHGFADKLNFATSLDNIAHVQNLACAFMDHWAAEMPERSHEVWYEDLVQNFEQGARRLVDFAGLEWDDACLDTHKTERQVLTASLWQIRQPVFTSAIGNWRNYQDELSETREKMSEIIEKHEARIGAQ